MRRRDFLLTSAAGALVVAPFARAVERFPYLETTIAQLAEKMGAGRLTARTLAAAYLKRVEAVDRRGPKLNSVIELNPDALTIAGELDRERKAGRVRGPLHGIPLLLKDNIATRDRMSTSAGSLALAGVPVPRDAHLAARLREAGAVILGKANLSEWANFRSTRSTSGWSARGGLTRNPYALDRNTSGSSSGSAAAVAASLAAGAIGTETDGSIVSPAAKNGIVGFKPTVGLVSRDGIVPIAASQDTAGPMTRTVTDAALLLSAIGGADPRDSATRDARLQPDYTSFLDSDGLRGARIGVARAYVSANDRVQALFSRALEALKAGGAEIVDPVTLPPRASYGEAELEVLLHEFKAGLAAYLAEFAPAAPIRTVDDLIAFNERHREKEMPHFGQELLTMAAARGGLDSPVYRDALEKGRRLTRDEGIDKALAEHRLDALIAPTGGPAWITDFINGDSHAGGFSSPAAIAGYPHITVPMGQVAGLPVGLSFVGAAWSEPTLLKLAYAYEQATRLRRPPEFARRARED
jgi:amidase